MQAFKVIAKKDAVETLGASSLPKSVTALSALHKLSHLIITGVDVDCIAANLGAYHKTVIQIAALLVNAVQLLAPIVWLVKLEVDLRLLVRLAGAAVKVEYVLIARTLNGKTVIFGILVCSVEQGYRMEIF